MALPRIGGKYGCSLREDFFVQPVGNEPVAQRVWMFVPLGQSYFLNLVVSVDVVKVHYEETCGTR